MIGLSLLLRLACASPGAPSFRRSRPPGQEVGQRAPQARQGLTLRPQAFRTFPIR